MNQTTASPLISVAELRGQLGKGVLVFDCRFNLATNPSAESGYSVYRQGHIPGAFYLDLEQDLSGPIEQHGGRHPLPSPEAFTQRMRARGLGPITSVVVYDDSRMAYAARAWWLLRYFGHADVRILDGGYRAWIAAGGAADRREPALKQGIFTAHPVVDWTRDYAAIRSAPENFTLIDSREPRRYQGIEEPIDPIAGHIPGALNYPWQEVTDDNGFFKPEEWHQQRWAAVRDSNEVTVYCGSGVTACVNLLSLEVSGIAARLYPGSWSDWCSYQSAVDD